MQVARSKASVAETTVDWCSKVAKTVWRMADCAGLGISLQIFLFFILRMKDEVISMHTAPSRKEIFVILNQETPPILLACFLMTEIGGSSFPPLCLSGNTRAPVLPCCKSDSPGLAFKRFLDCECKTHAC